MQRIILPVLTLIAVVGCNKFGGTKRFGAAAEYVTADIKTVNIGISGETNVDFLGTGGLDDQGNVWGVEARYNAGAELYGGGYTKLVLKGSSTVNDAAGLDFNGVNFADGTDINTKANYDIYKIYVANRAVTKGAVNQFAFVFEFIDFDASISEAGNPGNSSKWSHHSPLLLLGYEWETSSGGGGGATYYAKVEWMDLDVIRIGSTGGSFTDLSAGLKWSMGNPGSMNYLLIGYRYFDADLSISGNTMQMKFDGPVVGLNFTF